MGIQKSNIPCLEKWRDEHWLNPSLFMWLKIQIPSWGFQSLFPTALLPIHVSGLLSFCSPARKVLNIFRLRQVTKVVVPAIPLVPGLKWRLVILPSHPWTHLVQLRSPYTCSQQWTNDQISFPCFWHWAVLAYSNSQPSSSLTKLLRWLQPSLFPTESPERLPSNFLAYPLTIFWKTCMSW